MKSPDTLVIEQQSKPLKKAVGLDPLIILSLILHNWYYFVITIPIALFCARFYVGHTMPVYSVSATVLINTADKRTLGNNDALLQGLGLPGGMESLENQIRMLKSRSMIEKTLRDLPFEIEYYFKTFRNKISIYPEVPLKLLSDNSIPLPKDTEFSIFYLGNNMFRLESESENFSLQKIASFGETIEVAGGSFWVECRNEAWFNTNKDQKIFLMIFSTNRLISYYNSRLSVNLETKEGSMLKISMIGTNRAKDVDFINKLVEVFQSYSLDKKNIEAIRRVQFIDDQLAGISDSLLITENKLQQFRSSHRVMDLSAQGQAIISQVTLLENEKARLRLEANYYDYLADYLAKDILGESPIIPVTMGISDPALTRLVQELTTLQGQLSTKGAGDMNPLQRNLEQRFKSSKDALLETLNGLRRANSLARTDNQEQINKVNAQASALPVTERQLLGIERKFKLNDELYTFLLEKRAEQQMQKASNMAEIEVVDPADEHYSYMVFPNSKKIYFVGLVAGFGIPFSLLFLIFLFNKKLKDEDIDTITDLPIVGNIPHNDENTNTVVFDNPNSVIAESYRLLRTRMQFFIKDTKAPIILVTSSMPGDGKTFTAINLASVYSLLGKNTILVGFDLRKPKIFQDFKLDNEKGISTWLIGKDKLEDIIKETSFENLSVISAGPVPPNPSELTSLAKTNDLLKLLKDKYDYIIIDSSPLGIVSDTVLLASMADSCLLVVRPRKTIREMFIKTINEISISNLKGLSLVINDIKSDSKHYGYGEKYGYQNDTKQPKKRLFRIKKNKHRKH